MVQGPSVYGYEGPCFRITLLVMYQACCLFESVQIALVFLWFLDVTRGSFRAEYAVVVVHRFTATDGVFLFDRSLFVIFVR